MIVDILQGLIKKKINPFDVSYWTPVYFHPYTSLVTGVWVQQELQYKKLGLKPSYKEFKYFFDAIQEVVQQKGYNSQDGKTRTEWGNKVAVSLLGKNDEIIYLGWCDLKLCIGHGLVQPTYKTDAQSWEINEAFVSRL